MAMKELPTMLHTHDIPHNHAAHWPANHTERQSLADDLCARLNLTKWCHFDHQPQRNSHNTRESRSTALPVYHREDASSLNGDTHALNRLSARSLRPALDVHGGGIFERASNTALLVLVNEFLRFVDTAAAVLVLGPTSAATVTLFAELNW